MEEILGSKMGSLISKICCICRKSNKTCHAMNHHCICFRLLNCRHGYKKFSRCVEKGRMCMNTNKIEIICLASNHEGRIPIFMEDL